MEKLFVSTKNKRCCQESSDSIFKCLNCTDYAVCPSCKHQHDHPQHHLFVVLNKKIEEKISLPVIPEPISLPLEEWQYSIEGGQTDGQGKVVHPGIFCDGCEANLCGMRYKCGNCDDFDLCESCWKRGGKHPSQHAMILITNPLPRPTHSCFKLFDYNLYDNNSRASQQYYYRSCLQDKNTSTPVPLVSVRSDVTILDFMAEVRLHQTFVNSGGCPIEAVYTFPLDNKAAVCRFEVMIDERIVRGKVEEKQEAKDQYDDAIASGQGAYLLEQNESMLDVFTCTVGNLPPGKQALIQLTYLVEIPQDDGAKGGKSNSPCLRFSLPMAVALRYSPLGFASGLGGHRHHSQAQPEHEPISTWLGVPAKNILEMEISVRQSAKCSSVSSPSHSIDFIQEQSQLSMDETRVRIAEPCLDRDFVLLIQLEQRPESTKWIEDLSDPLPCFVGKEKAMMVETYPDLSQLELEDEEMASEFIFLLDRSGSMSGSRIAAARETLSMCLAALPMGSKFNIVSFGSSSSSFYPESKDFDDSTKTAATEFLKSVSANMGGTEILRPLKSIADIAPAVLLQRKILLFSDGEVSNTQAVIDFVLAEHQRTKTRYFTFGIGNSVSRALIEGVAQAGAGRAEFILEGERMQAKVMRQLKFAVEPALVGGSIISNFDIIPSTLPPIFQGVRLLFFSFLSGGNTEVPAQMTIEGQGPDGKLEFSFTLPEQKTLQGSIIHLFAAKRSIQELENRFDSEADENTKNSFKNDAIQLSVEYNIICRWTAFIAVEQRSSAMTVGMKEVKVPLSIIKASQMDMHYGAARRMGKTGKGRMKKKQRSKSRGRNAEKADVWFGDTYGAAVHRAAEIDLLEAKSQSLQSQHSTFLKSLSAKKKEGAFSRLRKAAFSPWSSKAEKAKPEFRSRELTVEDDVEMEDAFDEDEMEMNRSLSLESFDSLDGELAEACNVGVAEASVRGLDEGLEDLKVCKEAKVSGMKDLPKGLDEEVLLPKGLDEEVQIPPMAPVMKTMGQIPPTAPVMKTMDIGKIASLLELQHADGHWSTSDVLVQLLEKTPHSIAEQNPGIEGDAWITILVLAFLSKYFMDNVDEWQMPSKKAQKWLKRSHADVMDKQSHELALAYI